MLKGYYRNSYKFVLPVRHSRHRVNWMARLWFYYSTQGERHFIW